MLLYGIGTPGETKYQSLSTCFEEIKSNDKSLLNFSDIKVYFFRNEIRLDKTFLKKTISILNIYPNYLGEV